jgi:hypothetical protein
MDPIYPDEAYNSYIYVGNSPHAFVDPWGTDRIGVSSGLPPCPYAAWVLMKGGGWWCPTTDTFISSMSVGTDEIRPGPPPGPRPPTVDELIERVYRDVYTRLFVHTYTPTSADTDTIVSDRGCLYRLTLTTAPRSDGCLQVTVTMDGESPFDGAECPLRTSSGTYCYGDTWPVSLEGDPPIDLFPVDVSTLNATIHIGGRNSGTFASCQFIFH